MVKRERFWETIPLTDMNEEEWEALCDGCAKCCLHKFIDDDTEDAAFTDTINPGETIVYTNIVCHLLDQGTCSCTQYNKRQELVPECVKLTKDNLQDIFFMPNSCAYRRLYEGKNLPQWHPLLNNGDHTPMHDGGHSVRGKVVSEQQVDLEHFEDYIVMWPLSE